MTQILYKKDFISSLSSQFKEVNNDELGIDFINFITYYNSIKSPPKLIFGKKNNINGKKFSRNNRTNKNRKIKINKYEIERVNIIPLGKSKNAWTPDSVENKIADNNSQKHKSTLNTDKKIKGILNKITSKNYDKLIKQLQETLNDSGLSVEFMNKIAEMMIKKVCFDNKFHKLCVNICETI